MSGIYNAAGTRLAKAGVTTTAISDPEVVITIDLYDRVDTGLSDAAPEGSIKRLRVKAGTVMRQSVLDAMFQPGAVASIAPLTSAAAGGQVVTIRGSELDGVTSVTFGGTAGTALTIVSSKEVRVTTPAKTAGAHAVVVVDDGNNIATGKSVTFA